LPRDCRLLGRADYDAVYRDGRRRSNREFTVFLRPNGLARSRFGWSIKKALGGAVVRNRIKRRLREAFRLHRANLVAPWDIVLNPRRAAAGASFAEVQKALIKVFARCEIEPGFEPAETNDRTKVTERRTTNKR
jgi:ribonuclease P protein component